MTDTRGPLPIVVGVDGSAPALRALDWSVAEAVAMHRPLHIVHCLTGPLMRYPFVSSGTGPPDGGFRVAAQRVLTDALQHAQSAAPNIRVTTELVLDAPVSTLLRKALHAEFLVVGSGASTHLVGIRAESVGLTLAAHAPCPLVVVHSIPGDDPRHYEGGIVVGVARSHLSTATIRFAFQQAARRKVGLTAVWVWPPPVWGYPRLVTGLDRVEAAERQYLVKALAAERHQFPDVELDVKLVRHHLAGRALVVESADADLLVVGGGHGGLAGLLGGSITRSVVEHAKCPVAIVRREAATNGGTPTVPSQQSGGSRVLAEPRRSSG